MALILDTIKGMNDYKYVSFLPSELKEPVLSECYHMSKLCAEDHDRNILPFYKRSVSNVPSMDFWSLEDFKKQLNKDTIFFCVLDRNDKVVSMFTATPIDEDGLFAINTSDVYTLPEHRKKGLMVNNLKKALAGFKAHDKAVFLRVVNTNVKAWKLYEKLGFQPFTTTMIL